MKQRDVIQVRASHILETNATPAIVVKVLNEIGDPKYPCGLYLVQCIDDPIGLYSHTDCEGYVYAGPPYADGRLARYV